MTAAGKPDRAAENPERRTDQPPRSVSVKLGGQRLFREWKTLSVMLRLYCRRQHGLTAGLCPECQGLLDYAAQRLERCPFGEEKPTCAKCPIHCYQADRRQQVKTVMRVAGPRLLWHHPMLTVRHWLKGLLRKAEGRGKTAK